ncbi:hypothetical protein KKB64_05270 [Patescibacteria group bacterium]|nr:hypothetical protein [Patescibacteria group bacterium]MBU2544623.1 hypothetical protein [Patescibacteria group bacterium]
MGSDFGLVLVWWAMLFLVGAAAWPLTKRLFTFWYDQGYLFSKAVGMAVVTWIVYAAGTIRVLSFSQTSVWVSLVVVLGIGMILHKIDKTHRSNKTNKTNWRREIKNIIFGEVFFFAALLLWSWVKGHEPSIRGLEKFMDYGFMQSILNSSYFPPPDMWYPPYPINYYYFGHLVTAVLTKLSGMDLAVTFNLMLATIFALCLTMSFSIGRQLLRIGLMRQIGLMGQIGGGLLTAFLVTLAGNMQTIYAFTQGYSGDPPAGGVKPFWSLLWKASEVWQKFPEGLNRYWYANATRFIPLTIHEFPGYSFVVSDVHGHVLSIPFVLLAIGLLIQIFSHKTYEAHRSCTNNMIYVFYGFLVGVLLMTNALDGLIYLALFVAVILAVNMSDRSHWTNWKETGKNIGLVVLTAITTGLPFLSHFTSFVNGVAVNCPPAFLANTSASWRIGPIIFEGVEKCQRSPLWMMWLLWGFFIFCGGVLLASKRQSVKVSGTKKIGLIRQIGPIWNNNFTQIERLLIIFFFFSLALIIFPEFFYFKDIYPAHFRSNTMFKLGYQAFILFSIVAGYTIVTFANKTRMKIANRSRILFFILLLPQLFLVSIFPIFAVRSYFNGLKNYESIDGLGWLRREYPEDYLAIQWLNDQIRNPKSEIRNYKRFTLVEADGDSYTDFARFSAFTGIPTIIGWPVHEWLWRGSYDVVGPRREEVRTIYESSDIAEAKRILDKYNVRYIVAGTLEREKFKMIDEVKLQELGREVFRHMDTVIYEVSLQY